MAKKERIPIPEEIGTFIKEQCTVVRAMFTEEKEVQPMLILLTRFEGELEVGMAPLMGPWMDSPDAKDMIRAIIIPKIKEALKEMKKELVCICFISEAWAWNGTKEDMERVNGDHKKLPKKEVIIMSFDFNEGNKTIFYEIKRKMEVNEQGLNEVIELGFESMNKESEDDLTLDPDAKMGGRMSNLFHA